MAANEYENEIALHPNQRPIMKMQRNNLKLILSTSKSKKQSGIWDSFHHHQAKKIKIQAREEEKYDLGDFIAQRK